MQISKQEILNLIWERPVEIGHWVGFKDLTDMHNEWLRSFLWEKEDQTLQGHRGSYKTTTLSLFLAIHAIIRPNEPAIFFRKTATDVEEVIRQTSNILKTGCIQKIVQILYEKDLSLLKDTANEIQTNLSNHIIGASQIVGLGIGSSITGKHADIVITDDIVNINDRISRAEREKTKIAYQELQNIKNRGGRFINSGTPWHEEDCFTLMPNPMKYDCYSTGLMSADEIEYIRERMITSLFAANYELKHIADENVIFTQPIVGAERSFIENGVAHVDSAFYGEDYTAFSVMAKHGGKYYLYGRIWRKHVEDCYSEILQEYTSLHCGKLWNETNADKGLVAKQMKSLGIRTATYNEAMNKHIKIVTFLKAIWPDVIIVEGTDDKYLQQILDYTEDAEHDDAPDSAACLARLLYKPVRNRNNNDIPNLELLYM